MPYRTMAIDELRELDLDRWAANDSHLYLWSTNQHLGLAFELMQCWGYTYSTMLVWAKNPMGGGLGGAWGISTEYILFGRRGTLTAIGRTNRTWFNWKRPYLNGKPRHSAKPPEAYEQIAAISPGPRIEIFARDPRPGFDGWGDELADS